MDRKPGTTRLISIFGLILVVLVAACSRPTQHDARLVQVSGIVSDDPESALQILDSIDSGKLSDSDRHYYDFLTIKARDKNYVQHESDSLILDVLDYYSANPEDPLYIESLYYAGRVYMDLGDYPSALRHFQLALDNLGQKSNPDDLKGRLTYQTGMLYEQLRLYDDAVTFYDDVLNQSLEENDSVAIVYTLQRLGGIYHDSALQSQNDSIRTQYLHQADSILSLSLDYSESLPKTFSAKSRVLLAGVNQTQGNVGKALSLIQHTPDQVDPVARNVALAFAADIYLEAGINDTALMYARELIANEDMTNKRIGYKIVLSRNFRNLINPDTLDQYYDDYNDILDEYFDENRNARTLIQDTQYNYQLHERESQETHKENEVLLWTIVGCVVLVLILTIVVLYLKYRNKANILELRVTLQTLEKLKQNIAMSESSGNNVSKNSDYSGSNDGSEETDKSQISDKLEHKDTSETNDSIGDCGELPDHADLDSVKKLRDRLFRDALELSKRGEQMGVSPIILESEVYSQLRDLVASQKVIREEMWGDIEKTVLSASTRFNTNLRILTRNSISIDEFRVAWLVKCGFKPMEMCSLLAITHGAINSRRVRIGFKIRNEKQSVIIIDNLIRSL